MKHLLHILTVVMFLVCAGTAEATTKPVDSNITNVTVFTNQAMVTRKATADVGKGTNRLVVSTDAENIVRDSVTSAVFGEGEVLGVQVVQTPLGEQPREKIRDLESRLEKLETEKQSHLDAGEALSRQESFLGGIIDFSKDQVPADMKTQMPSPEYLELYLSFFDRKFNDLFDRRRTINGKISALGRAIEQVRREIALYRDGVKKTRTGIEILFSAGRDQSVNIEVRYRVAQAQWVPFYRASVDEDMKGVNLAMMAEIRQTTGEDWNDVELTVSNSVPVLVGRLPDLDPWWLDYYEPTPLRREDMAMKSAVMEQSQAPMAGAPLAKSLRRESALSFEYTMPAPFTVLSRQQETQVPLLTRALEGNFYHYTAPILTDEAYLVCEAKADREFLPGPVNVFFENSYMGRMILEERKPGDSFTLPLGIDRSVRIEREKLTDRLEETSFFGKVERKSVKRQLSYRIKAENLKEHPVTVRVRDHVPVSRTDRIIVDDISFSKPPDLEDVDGKSGVMQWNLELLSGTSTEIMIDFIVSYPREMRPPVF